MREPIKILHTGDWHIGSFRGPVVDSRNMRFEDVKKCLEYLAETAERAMPDLVIVSGDIFHQAEVHSTRVSKEVILASNIIRRLANISGCEVVVIRGTPNHDGAGQFELLQKILADLGNVSIVTTPKVVHARMADVACIPGFDKGDFRAKYPGLSAEEENKVWTEYIGQIVMGLKAECRPDFLHLFSAHYTVPGANTESGQSTFFSNFEPIIPAEALNAAKFDGVMLGHIHRPQEVEGLKNTWYCGAVNQMNFNDEGQHRGFYFHSYYIPDEYGLAEHVQSTYVDTPYRQFQTIRMSSDDVAEYLRNRVDYAEGHQLTDLVKDRIVRVMYSCTPEQEEALNRPVLQQDLYGLGAFYVADIQAENMIETTNHDLLSEESDPLVNLRKWLEEKKFPDPDAITELGEPIIREAQRSITTASYHGVFRPVSIEVHNYRTYKDEHFDFQDITYCCINGKNGAGKSSLFFDAILDALYEEPRDGDIKGWIRATDDARSGSIEFIFDIGADRFRVVRTRVKSGKGTLNLSKKQDDGWLNISKEKMADTQAEIIDVIGMDSLTFRSCALIMQDQYGLFLQASKEDRVTILGNLLGLGVYNVMYQMTREQLGDVKRRLAAAKEQIKVKTEIRDSKGDPDKELETIEAELTKLKAEEEVLRQKEQAAKNAADKYQAKVAEYKKASSDVQSAKEAFEKAQDDANQAKEMVEVINERLLGADVIRDQAEKYRKAKARAEELYPKKVEYENTMQSIRELDKAIEDLTQIRDKDKTNAETTRAQLTNIEASFAGYPDDIDEKLEDLRKAREQLDEIRKKMDEQNNLARTTTADKAAVDQKIIVRQKDLDSLNEMLAARQKQQEFLNNSGCIDIGRASCRFLAQAKEDVSEISSIQERIKAEEDTINDLKAVRQKRSDEAREHIDLLASLTDESLEVKKKISELAPLEQLKDQHAAAEARKARIEATIAMNVKIIDDDEKRLAEALSKRTALNEPVTKLFAAATEYSGCINTAKNLEVFADKEKQIPVDEERKRNWTEKYNDAMNAVVAAQKRLLDAQAVHGTIIDEMMKMDPDAGDAIHELTEKLNLNSVRQADLNISKGTLLQKIDDIEQMDAELSKLKKDVEEKAVTASRYEALKMAFSQDGVPHQIIRNIVPHITNTANNILGSMTGGTMGVEFVMEKTVKGKDGGERATLDILIDEFGKTKLPYAAKSGGEKVKSSLAVILALSEIKASAAGIQLGMLFIDEPPFLDEDGTQAYVDALEAIRKRYPDVKIMAITHDEAMKARFTQSVTVVKTAEGSVVME